MSDDHIIADISILQPYAGTADMSRFPNVLAAFIRHQCSTWPELGPARASLHHSMTKSFFLTDCEVFAQHNPHRIKSSSTRVDRDFIEQRPCFLCTDRLYERQKALPCLGEWLVLNNPFPIFSDHLVISHSRHLPQDIHVCIRPMIDFVIDTDGAYTAFYNGPGCGASAPDHLHFQACPEGGIPLTRQLEALLNGTGSRTHLYPVLTNDTASCYVAAVDFRSLFMCATTDAAELQTHLTAVLAFLKDATKSVDEPMVNIIISHTADSTSASRFMGVIFPRKAHRPACYFKKGDAMMLVSPGAVDVGGLVILPRHEDFDRMNREILLGIFSEVCHDRRIFDGLVL